MGQRFIWAGVVALVIGTIIFFTYRVVETRDAETRYRNFVYEQAFLLSDYFGSLGQLAETPKPDDPGWNQAVRDIAAEVGVIYDKVKNMKPPDRYLSVHSYYLKGIEHCENSCKLLIQAIEQDSTELFFQANDEALAAAEDLQRATDMMEYPND